MDIKRTVLWAVFSISGLMLYNNWLVHEGKPSLFSTGPATTQSVEKTTTAVSKGDVPTQISGAQKTSTPIPPAPASLESGEKFEIKNDVLSLEISANGASVIQAKLLKELEEDQKPVELFQINSNRQYFARSGLISIGNSDLPNHTTLFKLQQSGKDGSGRPFITLIAERSGVKLEKTFALNAGSYVVDVNHRITAINPAGSPVVLYTELVRDGITNKESQFYSTFTGPAVYTEKEKFNKLEFSDIEKNKIKIPTQVTAGEPAWVAMVQHYFASAWIPGDQPARDIYAGKIDNGLYRIGMQIPLGTLTPGSAVEEKAKLFVGPQEESVLETIAPGFALLKDYGYLTILAKPIFWLLEKIHGLVSNWGLSIILLTVLIKLVFFPLSAASYKSMARMKEVQPRLMAMKEQYKGDPQKLNQAMMEMYKKEKINPVGGCLPVVIQIPVFISLYWVLLSSVEMRNVSWLWVNDLAKPDNFFGVLPFINVPIGILPIVMAISMFIQTRLNPTPPDPIQAKVMLYMPIVFSLMFFNFPAGLVLYWVVNNVLSIAQQWQINKMFGKREVAK